MALGRFSSLAIEILLSADPWLPVRPSALARIRGIHLFTYEDYARATGLDFFSLTERYSGDGFTQYINGHFAIFYYHSHPARSRWTIMHELSHILLGHVGEDSPVITRSDRAGKDPLDIQADNLTARILCPEPVAVACQVSSPEELRRLCDLSTSAAKIQWNALSECRTCGRAFSSPEETHLREHFAPFINRYLKERASQEPEVSTPLLNHPAYRI